MSGVDRGSWWSPLDQSQARGENIIVWFGN